MPSKKKNAYIAIKNTISNTPNMANRLAKAVTGVVQKAGNIGAKALPNLPGVRR